MVHGHQRCAHVFVQDHVAVEPDDPAYDDPEWLADAAAGVLSNVDGYQCVYDEVAEVDELRL